MKKSYFKVIIFVLIIIVLIVAFLLMKDIIFPKTIFKLNGSEYYEHNLNDEYHDLGFTLTNGDSNEVKIESNVDVTKEGDYVIVYTYKDQVLTRYVSVKNINTITLIGEEDVYLLLNGEYHDPGIKAIINYVDYSNEVIVSSNIDYEKIGDYKITYLVKDKSLERNIHISDFEEYFKIDYDKKSGVDGLTLKISIDQEKVLKYILPDGRETTEESEYKVSKNGEYTFSIYDKYNNKMDKKINITNIKKEPIVAACVAASKNGKTTITVNSNKTISKYIYNGIESSNNTYTFDTIVNNNKVVLYDNDNQSSEITCTNKLGQLQIHFIKHDGFYDDAILIRSDNASIFIDGGRGSSKIIKYLNDLSVKTIDYVIGSHTEYDHIDAQGAIINNFDVKNALYANSITNCGCACDSKDTKNVLSALNKKNITPIVQKVPSMLNIGDMTLYFLAPFSIGCNKNNNSFIFILQYGNNKFMFTGDADSALYSPDKLLSNAKTLGLSDIHVDMVKYPHHGNQNIPEVFLDATMPKSFVVPNINTSDKPTATIKTRLSNRGIKLYRQSDSKTGNILIISDGNNIKYTMDVIATGLY